MAATGCVAQ